MVTEIVINLLDFIEGAAAPTSQQICNVEGDKRKFKLLLGRCITHGFGFLLKQFKGNVLQKMNEEGQVVYR